MGLNESLLKHSPNARLLDGQKEIKRRNVERVTEYWVNRGFLK